MWQVERLATQMAKRGLETTVCFAFPTAVVMFLAVSGHIFFDVVYMLPWQQKLPNLYISNFIIYVIILTNTILT